MRTKSIKEVEAQKLVNDYIVSPLFLAFLIEGVQFEDT